MAFGRALSFLPPAPPSSVVTTFIRSVCVLYRRCPLRGLRKFTVTIGVVVRSIVGQTGART